MFLFKVNPPFLPKYRGENILSIALVLIILQPQHTSLCWLCQATWLRCKLLERKEWQKDFFPLLSSFKFFFAVSSTSGIRQK